MWKKSQISLKYPSNRDVLIKSVYSWLKGKRIDDNAEGLWRIHNGLYDLSEFINKHPGGPDWIKLSKGIDITEAFEAHHISLKPEKILQGYKVRDASKPRNITLTLEENGFYKVLKARVREKLETMEYKNSSTSDKIHTSLLALTFITAILSTILQSKIITLFAGLFLTWTTIVAHNYFHKKDNWRMYTFNLSMLNYRDWRISHVFSHHIYTNSFHDLELSLFEPFFVWLPNSGMKNLIQRYGSWLYGPFIYSVTFFIQITSRLIKSIIKGKNMMYLDDLIPFTVPLAMVIFSQENYNAIFLRWLGILIIGSYLFGLIGLNAAHHHTEIVHDGDKMRNNKDWGLFQLDAVMDRSDLKGSKFLVLTHFGEHTLHHLFPTLDHDILPELYPILQKTINDFEGQIRECTWLEHIIGQHKQLARVTPRQSALYK